MKSLHKFLVISFCFLASSSFAQYEEIYAELNGDTVTLWEEAAWRNCASAFYSGVILEDHHMEWYQIDTGMTAVCNCFFNLSVTFGPLDPGYYTVDVFYTQAWNPEDTMYEGSTSFTIETDGLKSRSGILNDFQSDCYQNVGLVDVGIDPTPDFNVFPLPLKDDQEIIFEIGERSEQVELSVFDIAGRLIFNQLIPQGKNIRIHFKKQEIFPAPGIYITTLQSANAANSKLVPVL